MGGMEIIDLIAQLAGMFASAVLLVLLVCLFGIAFGRILYNVFDFGD